MSTQINKKNKILVIAKKEFFDTFIGMGWKITMVIFSLIFLLTMHFMIGVSDIKFENYSGEKLDDINLSFENYALVDAFSSEMIMGLMIATLLSLFSIILSYNSIRSEKDNNTLKVIFSYPIYRDEFINGKVLGKLLVIALMLFLSFSLSIMYSLINSIPLTFDLFSRIIIFFFLSLLFCSIYISFGIFIGLVTKTQIGGFMGIISFWFFTTIILPTIIILIPSFVYQLDFSEPAQNSGESQIVYQNQNPYDTSASNKEIYIKQAELTEKLSKFNFFTLYKELSRKILFISDDKKSIIDILNENSFSLIIFFMNIIFFLGLSYVTFLRKDLL